MDRPYQYQKHNWPIWASVLLILLFAGKISAQNAWVLKDYPGKDVELLTETYDGGIICQVFPWSPTDPAFNQPLYLVKYSMEGKKLWEKKLNNIFYIQGVSSTQDSGFIIAVTVFSSPVDSLTQDTSGYIALLKFDKCAHLQWARYVKTVHQGAEPTNVIENGRDFFLCTLGINGYDDYRKKPVTILKFDKYGALQNYRSFEGNYALLYKNQNQDTIYFSQQMSVPIGNDTTVIYAFSGIQSIDTSLKTKDSVVVGYYDRILGEYGPLNIKNNSIEAITLADLNSGKQEAMFTEWDKSLKQKGSYIYDSLKNYSSILPLFSSYHNDSTVVCYQVSDFTFLRMYNNNHKDIGEFTINQAGIQEQTNSFLALKNGNFIVPVVSINKSSLNQIGSSFYLFDHSLNLLSWPTVPPFKGYDWACNTTIPDSETINVDSVVTPVYVTVDTTRPNWHSLGILENAVQGRIENGWLTWPQPVSINSPLYFKSLANNSIQSFQGLDVVFYDMQGKKVYKTTAMFLSNNQWVIPSLGLTCPGFYMAELRNKRTGIPLGKIKVIVE